MKPTPFRWAILPTLLSIAFASAESEVDGSIQE